MAKGSRQQFTNCRFLSYQDTLYTNTGTQYFKDCYIQGDTHYISAMRRPYSKIAR